VSFESFSGCVFSLPKVPEHPIIKAIDRMAIPADLLMFIIFFFTYNATSILLKAELIGY
jgi:hypothetical protein